MRRATDYDHTMVLDPDSFIIRFENTVGEHSYQTVGLVPGEDFTLEEAYEETKADLLDAFERQTRYICSGMGFGVDMSAYTNIIVGDLGNLDLLIR